MKTISLLWQAVIEWFKDDALKEGAALSFYAMLALPSLVLVLLSLGAFFIDPQTVTDKLNYFAGVYLSAGSASVIDQILNRRPTVGALTLSTIFAFAVLLLSGSGLIGQLQKSLHKIWDIRAPGGSIITGYLKKRLLHLIAVLFLGSLLVFIMLLEAILSILFGIVNTDITVSPIFWQVTGQAISFFLLVFALVLIYRMLPHGKPSLQETTTVAACVALVITVSKYIVGTYITFGQLTSAYGAAGSLISLFLWIYFTSGVIFYGAEVIKLWCKRNGRPVSFVKKNWFERVFGSRHSA